MREKVQFLNYTSVWLFCTGLKSFKFLDSKMDNLGKGKPLPQKIKHWMRA